MPRERLSGGTGPAAAVRGAAASVLLFATLLLFNGLQLLSLLLVRPFSRHAFRRVNRWIADTWWGMCVVGAERMNGTRLVVSGDAVPVRENAIVISNHQQMPDITVLMALARSKHRLGDLKWFVKRKIQYVPGIGWGMRFLDCVFVHRDWSSDQDAIRRTFSRLVNDRVPLWLVSFVEGTRFTAAKHARSREYARRQGLPVLDHLLLPRTKGFVATLEGLRDNVSAVYDVTIGYIEGVPTLWQYITGRVQQVHVHIARFPTPELPRGEAAAAWLIRRFEEKDRLLEHFYAHDVFPAGREPEPEAG